jgi:hypothetical protein
MDNSSSNKTKDKSMSLDLVEIDNDRYYKIANHDLMRPFFMSIVSDSNHWMFISSNGGITAGRKNAEFALFPYYTDDKITENADTTGSKSIFRIIFQNEIKIWEPFSVRFSDRYDISRNLYKSIYGNKIIFEEVNHTLGLAFTYSWNTGNEFGFIRKSSIKNLDSTVKKVMILDGIQNVLPYGISSDLQKNASNLGDAYKRTELHAPSGLAIFALSAIIVDKAEPSEALKANVAWSVGLDNSTYLLSSNQLDHFRNGAIPQGESDVKGERGAYFICSEFTLGDCESKRWKIIADVNLNQSRLVKLSREIINADDLHDRIEKDIEQSTENLIRLIAQADGLQYTNDYLQDGRHYSNVLFNIMRGGIFHDNYIVDKKDFISYFRNANHQAALRNDNLIQSLPDYFGYRQLTDTAKTSDDADFIRLAVEYLPLKFSRRHGDPSRPWNKFSINLRNELDGSQILDYEGNWRDIFQNWEALAYSYPEFIDGMIFRFLNASTFDGYNPYRITKKGFDWETIEKDDPWSYIGYWGDHQIIYLQKFLEIMDAFHPGKLQEYIESEYFVYAHVPYIIKPYEDIVKNPKDTIGFDHELDKKIRYLREQEGSDGALLKESDNTVYKVNFIEKILATLLAKISNFVPEAGIWMNTQRPEWNDANNALVGNGVSMVTLYYMRRFLQFLKSTLEKTDADQMKISSELMEFYHSIRQTLEEYHSVLDAAIDDGKRKSITDSLGLAASDYRKQIYTNGFWGKKRSISKDGLLRFTELCLDYTDHTIRANKRSDGLYHAYNILTFTNEGISISGLDEMLEGQVAVMSSGFLNPEEAAGVLSNLRKSALYRPDQFSYLLYPNKELPGFLKKNNIPEVSAEKSALIQTLVKDGIKDIVEKDILGDYHFNGDFRNASDLRNALSRLALTDKRYTSLIESETKLLMDTFEEIFNHKSFTGRSGTFFAYEGLGSIYWHMVSKLLLAAEEYLIHAVEEKTDRKIVDQLMQQYREIKKGIGVHKSPELYGAFPTDPYSHTPGHKGAQQPGMTGQVKEDILVRIAELGVIVQEGTLGFYPSIIKKDEFKTEASLEKYYDVSGNKHSLTIEKNQLFLSFCQVPVIYELSHHSQLIVRMHDGSVKKSDSLVLDATTSRAIFERSGMVKSILVLLDRNTLLS